MSSKWIRRSALLAAIAGLTVPLGAAEAPESLPAATAAAPAGDAQAQVDAIVAKYDQAMQDFSAAYGKASAEERQKLYETTYPKTADYSKQLMAVARAHPKTPAAMKAIGWVLSRDNNPKGAAGEAMKLLAQDYAADPGITDSIKHLMWTSSPEAEPLFRAVIATNPDHDAKGTATFMLGRYLKNKIELVKVVQADPQRGKSIAAAFGQSAIDVAMKKDPAAMAKESEALFEQTEKEYADVNGGFKGTLGKSAAAELFELRNLAIGQPAPEITGEDIDGKPMKLSDFKGKVVLLDFWGDW
jgi:hypothetical protein